MTSYHMCLHFHLPFLGSRTRCAGHSDILIYARFVSAECDFLGQKKYHDFIFVSSD
jgi:hypothetical protein